MIKYTCDICGKDKPQKEICGCYDKEVYLILEFNGYSSIDLCVNCHDYILTRLREAGTKIIRDLKQR